MGTPHPLRGSCNCGRNNYTIAIPANAADFAHVFFDSGSENRRTQATPLTAWLHIPLTWFQSHTTSFFPDETHSMIRKTFTSVNEPHAKRNFCGFCGTHLTYWSEAPRDEADYLNVTVGSLFGEDLRTLEDLGLLPDDIDNHNNVVGQSETRLTVGTHTTPVAGVEDAVQRRVRRGAQGCITWMEEMIDGSRLGRSQKTKRGVCRNADGTTTVEWEITEIVDEGSEPEAGSGRGKRKLGEVGISGDTHMQS